MNFRPGGMGSLVWSSSPAEVMNLGSSPAGAAPQRARGFLMLLLLGKAKRSVGAPLFGDDGGAPLVLEIHHLHHLEKTLIQPDGEDVAL